MLPNAFEKCFVVRDPDKFESDDIIRKNESISYVFNLDGIDLKARHRLFFTGETQMFYVWKNEPDAKKMYFEIEDALDDEHAYKSRYCLNLTMSKSADYVKRVIDEIKWPPSLSYLSTHPKSNNCEFGIYVSAKDLKITDDNGFLRFVLEVWDKTSSTSKYITNRKADHKFVLNIEQGTYSWKKFIIPVEISKDNAARVAVTLEGMGYCGNVYFEEPMLIEDAAEGKLNVLPSFNTTCNDNEFFDWFGMNISKKEWPKFEISLNGKNIFDDELFERCHRYAEMEVAIPSGVLKEKDNSITFKLKSNYHGTLPYGFREIAILQQPGGHPFNIISVPKIANINEEIPVLIRTDTDDVEVKFTCEKGELKADKITKFKESGLNVLKLKAVKLCNNAEFCLESNGYSQKCVIERMVDRTPDRVMTGTSDQVYISQSYDDMEEFLSWYVANGVGKFLTIRPIYRWAGSRKVEKDTWRKIVRVFNDLGINYAHMVEGRDLPGMQANPSLSDLEGEHFLGRQVHERDGQLYYWGPNLFGYSKLIDIHYNLSQRLFMENGENTDSVFAPDNCFVYLRHPCWNHAENIDNDIKKSADDSISKLSVLSKNTPRHTGPTIMGKYFYKAGFEMFGAELMYGSLETNVAFLRGSAKSFGKKSISAHHALQWSSSPHDDPAKYRRYRLALYTGYMQGIHEINTEEGLWHLEEVRSYFNRFTEACSMYLKQQSDFAKYIDIHSRKGSYYTPIAYVHGNYDGRLDFGSHVFGVPEFRNAESENSWKEMLKLFYPLSKPDESIYIHPCPQKPVGYYSGTPMGNVDAISVEGNVNVISDYKCLVYVGYNLADEFTMDRLYHYVDNGGTVVLTFAHLTTTTNRDDVINNKLDIIDHKFVKVLTDGETPIFENACINGENVEVCVNLSKKCKSLSTIEGNVPLKAEIPFGKGKVILFNVKAYPKNKSIADDYLTTTKDITMELNRKEDSFIECSEDIEFTIYDRKDGVRDIYVIAVDWYNNPELMRKFTLRVNNDKYDIEIPFGVMIKISIKNDVAVFSKDENVVIDFINDNTLEIQGYEQARFCIAQNGNMEIRNILLSNESKTFVEL